MESGDEDDVAVGARDYQKMKASMWKSGFREGATVGKQKGLQASFDAAYQLAYKYSLKFGQLQGQIECSLALKPKTQERLQPLLEDLKEYVESCFLTTGFPSNEKTLGDTEKVWSAKLKEFIEIYLSVCPAEASVSNINDLTS